MGDRMETEVKAAYDRDAFQASGKSPAIRHAG
jgi:hypothetical protein